MPDDQDTPRGRVSDERRSKITYAEASPPAVGFKDSGPPACLLLRGHCPTWGEDQHAYRRWEDAADAWLADHPAGGPGAHLLRPDRWERGREPTRSEVDRMLQWARLNREDIPAIAAQARRLFPQVFDARAWWPDGRWIDDAERARRISELAP